MITVDGKMRRLDNVEDDEVREHLLTALGNILAEEGVDVEQVNLNRLALMDMETIQLRLKGNESF